jgi:hypothetical protein
MVAEMPGWQLSVRVKGPPHTQERQVVDMRRVEAGKLSKEEPLWAYAYQLLPPRSTDRMRAIRELVNKENADALRNAGTWTARLVSEPQVTHVLIFSDTPDLDGAMNRRLEARLRELDLRFTVTLPMRVDEPSPEPETP